MNTIHISDRPIYLVSVAVLIFILALVQVPAYAQLQEPQVRAIEKPISPLKEGFHNRIGGSIFVNNFGFGISGVFGHAIGPYSEITFKTGITGIRDVTEQNFQTFFSGPTVANKYNRALGFPFLVGLKHRVFPKQTVDNFRFFVAASAGPALAFVYPYIKNDNGNGFRDQILTPVGLQFRERKNDFFSGLGDGHTRWGASGELKVGVDLGGNFKRQTTVEIGYFFYYFKQGLQILEPYKPFGYTACDFNPNLGCPVAVDKDGNRNPFYGKQKFFGTPQIKFTFSGWW